MRLMVFNETAERGNPAETVLVNPVILEASRAAAADEEGCLSFPRIYADVEVGASVPRAGQLLCGGGCADGGLPAVFFYVSARAGRVGFAPTPPALAALPPLHPAPAMRPPCGVQRSTKIEVQFQDLSGETRSLTLKDFAARVFQHEYDHLQVRPLRARTSAAAAPRRCAALDARCVSCAAVSARRRRNQSAHAARLHTALYAAGRAVL